SRPEQLLRPEGGFVRHFTAFRYPVAQIEPRQARLAALLDLPEYRPGAQAARGVRFEEGVDRRVAVWKDVDDRNDQQSTGGVAKFHELRVDTAGQQELPVLPLHVVIHAGTGVP